MSAYFLKHHPFFNCTYFNMDRGDEVYRLWSWRYWGSIALSVLKLIQFKMALIATRVLKHSYLCNKRAAICKSRFKWTQRAAFVWNVYCVIALHVANYTPCALLCLHLKQAAVKVNPKDQQTITLLNFSLFSLLFI